MAWVRLRAGARARTRVRTRARARISLVELRMRRVSWCFGRAIVQATPLAGRALAGPAVRVCVQHLPATLCPERAGLPGGTNIILTDGNPTDDVWDLVANAKGLATSGADVEAVQWVLRIRIPVIQ